MQSDLLKISRAIENDVDFTARINIACELAGIESSRTVFIHVAKACVGNIEISEEGAIWTGDVEDIQITDAVNALLESLSDEEES